MNDKVRVQFAYGKDSSPGAFKVKEMEKSFNVSAPWMDTADLEACVAVHEGELKTFRPDVVVGSSFGGAVICKLLERGRWKGPTLLLAPAAVLHDVVRLPPDVPLVIVHGRRDENVDLAVSQALVKQLIGAVRLDVVDDDHGLGTFVTSGRLIDYVRKLAGQ